MADTKNAVLVALAPLAEVLPGFPPLAEVSAEDLQANPPLAYAVVTLASGVRVHVCEAAGALYGGLGEAAGINVTWGSWDFSDDGDAEVEVLDPPVLVPRELLALLDSEDLVL